MLETRPAFELRPCALRVVVTLARPNSTLDTLLKCSKVLTALVRRSHLPDDHQVAEPHGGAARVERVRK